MIRIILCCYLLLLLSCGSAEDPASKPPTKIEAEEENDLLLRLSSKLIYNPQLLEQQEENQILNYAIENLLDVKRSEYGMYYIKRRYIFSKYPTLPRIKLLVHISQELVFSGS